MTEPLFRRLLGDAIDDLPSVLRRAHDSNDCQRWIGKAQVVASRNLIARALCWMMGLPKLGASARRVVRGMTVSNTSSPKCWRTSPTT